MPPSGVDYASGFLNGYAPEYVNDFFRVRPAVCTESVDGNSEYFNQT